jgi:cytochrome P450
MTPATDLQITEAAALPPAPQAPRALVALAFTAVRRRTVAWLSDKYGPAVTLRIPVFGDTVMVADPVLAKQVFTTSPDVLHNIQPNLSRLLGAGSVFGLEGAAHRRRRKLLTPPFHGKSIAAYERIVEEETMREMATWPDRTEFETLEPMMRITLNVILRAVFGADGAELQQLRELLPKWVTLGSRLSLFPTPTIAPGRWGPWRRLAEYRRTYESLVDKLIERARRDPHLEDRTDVLSIFLRSTYDCSRCWPPGMRPPRRRWRGPSNASPGTRRCWTGWWPRWPVTTTATGRPPFSRFSVTARSSTSPAATSQCRPTNSGNGACPRAIRSW